MHKRLIEGVSPVISCTLRWWRWKKCIIVSVCDLGGSKGKEVNEVSKRERSVRNAKRINEVFISCCRLVEEVCGRTAQLISGREISFTSSSACHTG